MMTDLEGISGINSMDMIEEYHPNYQKSINCLIADVNAAVDGAFSGGASEVYVCDGHKGGRNFIIDLLGL